MVVFWSGDDFFDNKSNCVVKCDDQIGEDFAEALKAFPGHKFIFGPGDAKTWNFGRTLTWKISTWKLMHS